MINWKDVTLTRDGKSFKDFMTQGAYLSALYLCQFYEVIKGMPNAHLFIDKIETTVSEVDFSGLKSVLVLLEEDKDWERGYFDPVNPIKPEEIQF